MCQVKTSKDKERLLVRALAEAGKGTEAQRNCQSGRETLVCRANLVKELPRGWNKSDVGEQEIARGSKGNSASGQRQPGQRGCKSKIMALVVMEKCSNGWQRHWE